MDVDEFEHVLELLPEAFSEHHATLVKICFGAIRPDPSAITPVSNEQCLELSDLRRLHFMVLVEFASSLSKEMFGSEETRPKTDPNPNPYDVFLMETTMDRPTKHIAVCVPVRRHRELAWYNGGKELIQLKDLTPKWRVASLSGPCACPSIAVGTAQSAYEVVNAAQDDR